MKTRIIRLTALLIALLTPLTPARAGWRGGIGVLGDSYSDEYQFYPPHRSTARNWVEILAATRGLNFGRFSTRSRGEPRNQGYEYNWARSDATTDDLIVTGQHTGLAAQVARGEVNLVVVFIGGNDFINAMKTPDPAAAFQQVGPRAEANLERAVATILKAHPDVKVVMVHERTNAELAKRSLAFGAFDCVTKPVDPPHLLQAIEAALALRRVDLGE